MKNSAVGIFLAFLAAGSAAADTVYLRDGSVRQGLVESRTGGKLLLRVDRGGISGAMEIPMADIERVVLDPRTPEDRAMLKVDSAPRMPNTSLDLSAAPASEPAVPAGRPDDGLLARPPAGRSGNAPPGGATGQAAPVAAQAISDAELAAYGPRGFFGEMIAALGGEGPDQLNRLPAAARDLWNQAAEADQKTDAAATLDALRALEFTMRGLPGGAGRLDAISRGTRNQSFGLWMATVHWQTISGRYSVGQFDLADVREIERPFLIGLLKEKNDPALEPLRMYFPPVDEKSGQAEPFRPAQLQGITAADAMEIKDKAAFAAAVLLAQLKLEPGMDAVDRGFISGQLADVNRVLSKARELEPAAKMAAARADQDSKAAAAKAQRDAAVARAQASTRPH